MKSIKTLLFFALAAAPVAAFGQQPFAPAPPMIIVAGNAQIEAPPDQALIRLGVVQDAQTAQAAQDQTNGIARAILAAIGKLGVPAQRIQTSRIALTPVYAPRRPDSRDAPRIVSYNASNIVTIDLDNLAQVGPVIDAGLGAGANEVQSVQFKLKNDEAVRQQALKQAVGDAQRKAAAIAEALGVRLAGVLEVSENGVSVMAKTEAFGGVAFARAAEANPTPASPGLLEVNANVSLKYRIEETR